MDEKELMAQFAAMLQENNTAVFGRMHEMLQENNTAVFGRMHEMFQENNAAIFEHMQEMRQDLRQEIAESKTEVMAYIENTTNKRIDSLFDGYVSTRERQDAVQKELETMRERLTQLEMIVKSLASAS